jgi:hypothetical protein
LNRRFPCSELQRKIYSQSNVGLLAKKIRMLGKFNCKAVRLQLYAARITKSGSVSRVVDQKAASTSANAAEVIPIRQNKKKVNSFDHRPRPSSIRRPGQSRSASEQRQRLSPACLGTQTGQSNEITAAASLPVRPRPGRSAAASSAGWRPAAGRAAAGGRTQPGRLPPRPAPSQPGR